MTPIPVAPDGLPPAAASYAFLDFELVPHKRTLYFHQRRVPLGSRAYDVLLALVERAGRLVSKEELIALVWPDTIVEDGNLRVQISALRKALREEQYGLACIDSVARGGYVFSAAVLRRDSASAAAPRRMEALTGREDDIAALCAQLQQCRFLSLTGAAGVGKSVVGAAAVAALAQRLGVPYQVIDAAPGIDAEAALRAVGPRRPDDPAALPRAVILLDDCDQATRRAAALVTRLRAARPDLLLLATSREPLRVQGETVRSLAPLALPPHGVALTPAQAYAYPSVRLFCERVRALCRTFTIGARDVGAISAICRELDGIPLALELAALNMELFTPQELLPRMQDRFQVLATAGHGAIARHQSMWAALEWGFERLALREKIILQRLALFRNTFSHGSAATLVCCEYISASDLNEALPRLQEKSLLQAEPQDGYLNYRMPNTLRAFALCKLQASSDPLFHRGGGSPPARARH